MPSFKVRYKMPHYFVLGCPNNTRARDGLSYHSLPKDTQLRSQWLNLIGRDPNSLIIYERVCSDHFSEDDIVLSGNRRYLNPNVVHTRAKFTNIACVSEDGGILKLPVKGNVTETELTIQPIKKKLGFLVDNVNKEISSVSKCDKPLDEPVPSGSEKCQRILC